MPSTTESPEIKPDGDGDDSSFIRTEDVICLVCTSGESTKRGYLAADGFGSQLCHLEPEPRNQDPCELWKCKFIIEDAMSVHAMYSQGLKTRMKKQSSRKILMYGHAVLLRHCNTKKLLRCLPSSSTSEKMAYDIGFTQQAGSVDENCWFTVRPASNQRSAGEKVRAGDDVYLVGVANERFLSAQPSFFYTDDSASEYSVLASFHQCVWSLHIVCSGSAVEAAIGHVNGGDVMRFVHRYRGSDVLTVVSKEYDKNVTHPLPKAIAFDVRYEKMSESIGLRSLWRVELFQMRFGGGFVGWGQPFRLRHMATGKFLGISDTTTSGGCGFEDEPPRSLETKPIRKRKQPQQLTLISDDKATKETTSFCFSTSNVNSIHVPSSSNRITIVDNMGKPQIAFGDSEVYLVHYDTHKLVGCPVSERRHRVMSVQRKAIMQEELHRSFAFTATRASEQEAKAASNIQLTQEVMRNYVHKVILSQERHEIVAMATVENLEEELNHVLDDLCYYFRPPDTTGYTHDSLSQPLSRLKERQNLFRSQGMLQFTLTVIMKTTKLKSASVRDINHKLYKLLAAMIRGNHGNCRVFATEQWLGQFMKQLSLPQYTHSVLDVIQCLLEDSPEVLNLFSPDDIATIVNLLNTSGRDEKVMRLLSSLCVCHDVAMRDKQRLIYRHLSSCQDLLLQTSLQNHVNCVHPSISIGACDGSATYHKWYFEVQVTQLLTDSRDVHFRVGWGHVTLFLPTPTSNSSSTTAGGIGDDVYSVGFDGARYWVGGRAIDTSLTFTPSRKLPRQEEHVLFSPSHSPSPTEEEGEQLPVSIGDVIGCCLDLERGVASFLKNGVSVEGHVEFHHCCKNITPALSFSAGVSVVMSLGGDLGKFVYGPPEGYAGMYKATDPDKDIVLQPFRCLGDPAELLVYGPAFTSDYEAFVPAPINTSTVSLPDPIKRSGLQDKLAKNIHELWSKNKIEAGYSYGEVRNDDLKHNPCLKPFEELSEEERCYDYDMATQTLATLIVLGYQISTSDDKSLSQVDYTELPPDKYQTSNGYIPQPLNLDGIKVPESLSQLVEKLAENAHNVWAASRIKQGWTYGKANDSETKRNKYLVPYSKLDEAGKKSNRDTAYETIRTICALGCKIIPPPSAGDAGTTIQQLAREFSHAHVRTRTFRGQTCYKITKGKWYYEVKLLTGGMMRIGWATPTFPAGKPLGSDKNSYAYDGCLARKWHRTSESFGHRWSVGDIVGCFLDIEEKIMSYSLNGEILQDSYDSTIAFSEVDISNGLVPAITLFAGERAKMNFGHSEEPLRCSFATSGFQPVCSPTFSLHYNIPLWYSAPGDYDVIDSIHHPRLREKRVIGGGQNEISMIEIHSTQQERARQECLKLNFGVTISSDGVDPEEIARSPRRNTLPSVPVSKERAISFKRYRHGRSFSEDDVTSNVVSYSVVVPAGQYPEGVFVGWTTAGFRYIQSQFQSSSGGEGQPDSQKERQQDSVEYGQQVKFMQQRTLGGSSSVSNYSTAFMVRLSDLLPSPVPARLGLPVEVTCVLNTVYGEMTFTCLYTSDIGDACTNKRAVLVASPGTKLFPTSIITPMSDHVIDFDLSLVEPYRPLSSVFKPLVDDSAYLNNPTTPLCPRRIKVVALTESCWRRQPMYRANYKTSVGSGGALQVTTEKEPSLSIFFTLPQEDRVMDILEISEKHDLMNFHIRTLEAYAAVCSHSNLELAEAISQRMNCKQLLQCLKTGGMRSELKAAYLKLVTYLHLEHEVQTRLLMRGEFILPLNKCTHSVPLFPLVAKSNGANPQQEYNLKSAMLPGICLGQSAIQHNITSSFSNMPFCSAHPDTEALVTELKELIFQELEKLLSTRYYTMKLLPIKSRSQIFVPMIEMLDNLLVMGVIQSETDIQRLLCLLNPERLAPNNSSRQWSLGLLSAQVTSEEDMKLALCNLLQHLCDCQVQHRVESIVMFANGYVEELRQEQKYRHDKYFMKNPKEFRCSPEQQLQTLLSFKNRGPRQRQLKEKLEKFHHELLDHCGAVKEGKSDEQITSVWRNLQTMIELLFSTEEQCHHGNGGDHVTSLQKLITETMMEWVGQEIHSLKLIGQIFALLYRQFDEIHEVKQALLKTYIIDIKENDGRPNYNIEEFRDALGSLRLLMKVGMGKTEENLLRDSLRTIQNSELFYCHPHLLRQLGVHTILLDLMKTYLGLSSKSSVEEALLSSRRKHRLYAHLDSSATPPVADCCRFLCNFARISQANQRALFGYLTLFLDHVDEYPDVMSYSGYTPLDVATATIKGNQELVLALEESHLEHVVQLLVVMTTNPRGSSEGSSIDGRADMAGGLGLIHRVSFSFNYEWSPQAGQKCLEFLHAAVWVDNEQVQENAHVIVRLLIHHSECLGPALAGDAHGLHKVYNVAIDQLPFNDAELPSNSQSRETLSRLYSHESTYSTVSSQSSILGCSSNLTTQDILSFYTDLLLLLAYCAAGMTSCDHAHSGQSSTYPMQNCVNKQKQSAIARTRNILQNLIKTDDLIGILSLKFARGLERGVSPGNKEAAVLFLERAYGITSPDLLLKLLIEAFLPDIKLALKLCPEESALSGLVNRYLCCSVFPLLSHHASVFPKVCSSHLHVVDSLLSHCFRLCCNVQLSAAQKDNLTTFFINVIRELHPQTIQKFMPRIISDIPHFHSYSVVSYKLLSAHYEHFSHYYQSDMLDHTSLGLPSNEEKTYSALVVYRLTDTLAKNLPSSGGLLRASVSCLKSVSCALVPDCSIPNEAHLSKMYSTSLTSYDPHPTDTSKIAINHKLKGLVIAFAAYKHDCWVLDRQNEGWSHGVKYDEERRKHPNIKPFNMLSQEDKVAAKAPVMEAVKYAVVRGWSLGQVKCAEFQNVPLKQKLVCMRRPRSKKDKERKKAKKEADKKRERESSEVAGETIFYEPESVYDLSKVGMRINLLSLAERMAENAHNRWALQLKENDANYASHSHFVPYELLDETRREELRTFTLDLLRYVKVSGYDITRNRLYGGMSFAVSLDNSFSSEADPSAEEERKFCLQFFDRFLNYLTMPSLNPNFYLKVLFPVMTSYLQQHRTYFMPSEGQRGHSFASREEKLHITVLFCQVMEFTRKNLDHLFPSLKKPSANVFSPGDGEGGVLGGGGAGPPAETDQSWAAVKCILSLLKAIISAMDVKSIANSEEASTASECTEMTNFFRQATSGIVLTAKNINKLDKCDAPFTFYCLQLLIPSLTALFRHVGLHKVGDLVIQGSIKGQCRFIFQNLVDMAMGTGPVYVGSSPLVLIGQCMGAFALAYPDPFLDTNLFGFCLQSLLDQLDHATQEGVTCGNVLFVVDVVIPVLASYIIRWNEVEGAKVPETCAEEVLTQVLSLIEAHFCQKTVPWVIRVIESSVLLAGKCSLSVLTSHLVPLMEELRERAIALWQDEHYLLASWNKQPSAGDVTSHHNEQEKLAEDYRIFIRDLLSVLPYLTLFLHSNQSTLTKTLPTLLHNTSSSLFISVADIFHCWGSSQFFRRQLQMMALQYKQSTQHIMWSSPSLMVLRQRQLGSTVGGASGSRGNEKKPVNLLLVILEFLVPLCDHSLSLKDRQLVDWCKSKLGNKGVVPEDLKTEIMRELKTREGGEEKRKPLARKLVKRWSMHIIPPEKTTEERALHILSLARVKFRIQQVDKGHEIKLKWKQLLSQRKRKAIIGCFLAIPFFNLSKHRCMNMFLQMYCSQWLVTSEHSTHDKLTEELLDKQDYLVLRRQEEMKRMPEDDEKRLKEAPDPLTQLLHMFKRIASSRECIERQLYISYMDVLSKSVVGHQEDDEMMAEDNSTKAYVLYSEEKARLMVKQAQLADRGAPAMVLLVLMASDGKVCPIVHSTLKLGIALLKEGNQRIQSEMLEQLKGIDAGFLHSIAKMIASCSVLDWNAYERYNKSEPVVGQGTDVLCKVLPDHLFTKSLFRFLQLLCEGHNADFQNYLRTQAGNTTTVNIVISTVDYLLRLQESISDFYWHYTDYHTIDIQGRENFLKAFKVAKQVFRTLTEYIQGPCVLNQEALSRSRLWDAVSGFLHIFAVLQRKLYKDTSQVELLRELLSLQEEMFILLLSMLEGSAMSSAIGKLMVDMLIESAGYIEDIMTFFNMFVKLNDFSTAKAFREFDLNKDGFISYREFEMAMKAQQRYTEDEIVYLMECADLNNDGLLDYLEFTERFYQPAANIGFHLCVLVVHLSDHLPEEQRLEMFKSCPNAKQLMEHFEKNMGCIEIMGKSKRIERVYFEIKESRLKQWDEPHIRESRRNFLHSVELGSQKRKLQGFVSFCEDTIFEINHTDSISGSEQMAMETRALQHRQQHNRMRERPAMPFLSRMKEKVTDFQQRHTWVQRLLAWLLSLCVLHLLPMLKRAAASVKRNIPLLYKRAHQKITNYFKKSPPTSTTDSARKSTRRHQLKLNIPLPQIQINGTGEPAHARAQTTVTERHPTLRHRMRGELQDGSLMETKENIESRDHDAVKRNGEARRGTVTGTVHLQRGISEERRGSLSHTPRAFKLRQLTLNYDRSKMKAPSQASEGTTPANTPMMDGIEQKAQGDSQNPDSYQPRIVSSSWSWSALLARHYSTLTNFKLLVTLIINVLLLTYKVETLTEHPVEPREQLFSNEMAAAAANTTGERLRLEGSYWAPLFLNLLALAHFVLSAVLIASYWHFKVPLIIFKREKQVARRLEKLRLWITSTPLESWVDKWDSLVVGSVTFPRLYWDKQVKERVCEHLRVGEEKRRITRILGMEVRSKFEKRTKWDQLLDTCHSLVDVRYRLWSLGVTLSDVMIIYHMVYCLLSFIGLKWNIFYFSIHLLDLITHFKRLRTVLNSVLHNIRQLVMTALLMIMVIYLYTVIAFNFFRQFYHESTPEGSQVYNCDSMLQCFVYHINHGLRSGGGIADVLEPASGDLLRLLFDITFFFVVIIILLAIIQGLIIDAFGELRDKEDSLTAEMQNKCFICGLPKNEFDHVPHGFDNHTSKQHNMAHYMFFLLYLIKKKESEFSGQESYVWEMYLKHNWDFFPVGDCFHAQEERSGAVGVAGAGLTHPQRRLMTSSPQHSPSVNRRTN